jgi:hypothetical protein
MFSHPDFQLQHGTEVQRQYLARAEQYRLRAAARKARRRHEHVGKLSGLTRILYAVGLRPDLGTRQS